MTARDTVLVAEINNKRIQEVTLEGAHVKFIPLNRTCHCVAVHGDLVAVVTVDSSIELYNYTTGALVRTLSTVHAHTWSICFAPDGKLLAVAGIGRMALVSVDGQCWQNHRPQTHPNPRQHLITSLAPLYQLAQYT